MNKLNSKIYSLQRTGSRNSIEAMDRHNRRHFSTDDIDTSRSHLNLHLVEIPRDKRIIDVVMEKVRELGIDPEARYLRNKNRIYALELLLTVTSGFECDFNQFYMDCLNYIREIYSECPIVHAVVHHDENTPHMHVILIPIRDGKLDGDKVKGFWLKSKDRNIYLFNQLCKKYDLEFPVYLQKAHKKAGTELAMMHLDQLKPEEIGTLLLNPIKQSIHARPEPYLHILGVSYEDVISHFQQSKSNSNIEGI